MSLIFLYLLFWWFAVFEPFVPEYLFLWFPLPLMALLYLKWKDAGKRLLKRKNVIFLVLVLIMAVLPNVAAYVSIDNLLNQAASATDEWQKASYISKRVIETTAFGWPPRADTDYWKFVLSGAGMCKEMAITGTDLILAAGLDARRVVLPGEDHTFIEVKIDSNWLVADPGYYGGELINRTERARRRIQDVGSISYAIACIGDSFVELTQQYVSTDTIMIRITRNGEPLADTEVVLKHRFGQLTTQLPCNGRTFHTDVSGTVTLHLGKPYYIDEYKGSEEYYWIYVNEQNTGRNVTSTGTGQIHMVEIDLADSSLQIQNS
jgi:hypothetical protein